MKEVSGVYSYDGSATLAAAAHELQAPLILMKQLSETLQSFELKENERTAYFQRLLVTSERMLHLTQHLLSNFALREQSELQLEMEPINVSHICEDILQEFTAQAAAKKQILQLAQGKHVAIAHREAVRGIVASLVDNALQHAPDTSIVNISTSSRNDHVRLRVSDDGLAVSLAELRHLNHHAGRQRQPLITRGATSGLGLYLASQFAEAMGGQLGVGRRSGGGDFFVDMLRSRQLSLLV